jgi:hypothetical protein
LLVFGTFVLAVTPPGEEPSSIEDWQRRKDQGLGRQTIRERSHAWNCQCSAR